MAMSTQTVQAAGATGAKTAMEPTLAAECSPSGPPSDTKESSHASKETGSPEETRLKLEVLRLLFKAENMPDLLQCSTGEVLAKYLCRNSRWQSSSASPIHHLELSPATIDTLSTLQTNRTKLSTYYLLGHTLFSSESLSRIDAPFATRTKPSNLSVLDRLLILNVKNPDLANLFSQVKAPPADEYARCSIYRLGRGALKPSKSVPPADSHYEPYAIITEGRVRTCLYKIAKDFQLVDTWFAEFYKVAVPYSDNVSSELKDIHDAIRCSRSDEDCYLGPLGDFLEVVTEKKRKNELPSATFKSKDHGADAIAYLQDGLEIPYWQLLARIFVQMSEPGTLAVASGTFFSNAVTHAINSMRLQIRLRLQCLECKYAYELPKRLGDGINGRLAVLDYITESTTPELAEEFDLHAELFRRSPSSMDPINRMDRADRTPTMILVPDRNEGWTDLEKVGSTALFIIFLPFVFVPASIGIARYVNMGQAQEAIGSSSEADFMWLIAGTLQALLGNIFAVVPLWKLTRGSWIHRLAQAFIWFSVALGVASIASYCFVNKAWSSLASLLSSFFAIGAVYFSTQHVSAQSVRGAVREVVGKAKTE